MIVRRQFDPKLEWFRQARFGMFVHFGLYALLGRGEWVMYREGIAREEYEKLMHQFNPWRFDADEWVETARQAGARYITVTAKHHDGFCLFDSALTDYKITNTPFGRDLIGELIEAGHRRRMPIVLYYSQPDWHHPNFVHRPEAFKDWPHPRPGDEPDWPRYQEYLEGQVLELCTKYGKIGGIWFDGVHKTEQEWRGRRLWQLIKKHQPSAVVNERAGFGDFFTPERRLHLVPAAAGYMVEVCQSVCADAWGYREHGRLFSTPALVASLVTAAGGGGNFLLNIGPRPDGTLPEDQVERLLGVGQWLSKYGRAIYGTRGFPAVEGDGKVWYTARGSRLYVLFQWPETDALVLDKLLRRPLRARLLGVSGRASRLEIEQSDEGVVLAGLPAEPVEKSVNVAELVFDKPEDIRLRRAPRPPAPPPIDLGSQRQVILRAEQARREGFGPKGATLGLTPGADKESGKGARLGPWSSPEQKAVWVLRATRPGRWRVVVEMACPAPYSGSTFEVRLARQKLTGSVPETAGFGDFLPVELGELEIPAGQHRLTLQPRRLNYGYIFAAVRAVVLKPVRPARAR